MQPRRSVPPLSGGHGLQIRKSPGAAGLSAARPRSDRSHASPPRELREPAIVKLRAASRGREVPHFAASPPAMKAPAADSRRCPRDRETPEPDRWRCRGSRNASAGAAFQCADGAQGGVSIPDRNIPWLPEPQFSVSLPLPQHFLDPAGEFPCLVFIGTNNQNSVVTGNRAYKFRPIRLVESRGDGLRAADDRFHDQKILRATDIEYELAHQPGDRGQRHADAVVALRRGISSGSLREVEVANVARQGRLSHTESALAHGPLQILLAGE